MGTEFSCLTFDKKKKTNGYSHCLEIAKANIMQCNVAKKIQPLLKKISHFRKLLQRIANKI